MNRNRILDVVIIVLAVVGAINLFPALFDLTRGFAGSFIGLLITILLWMLSGVLAGRLMRGRGYGPLRDILLGFAGGIVGTWVFRTLGFWQIYSLSFIGTILTGVVGAVLIIFLARLFDRNFGR
ncbi:MAG: GlsB/YeaQ/YmgE family stress response membrane protein [Phototrophicaceae bacterium]|jgi:uncharacterized membrane protein YeaQ/YmgE (transglycosylase-associated protein family)